MVTLAEGAVIGAGGAVLLVAAWNLGYRRGRLEATLAALDVLHAMRKFLLDEHIPDAHPTDPATDRPKDD